MFFLSYMLVVDHLHMTLISESFWMFSFDLRTGNFDFDLLRPTHSIFNVFFKYVRPSGTLTIFVIYPILIYFGIQNNLSIISWITLPLLILLSFTLLAIIEIFISTSMFWSIEGIGINFLRMQVQSFSRWPDFIYSYLTRKILSVFLPVLLIGTAPVSYLFNSSNWQVIIYLFLAIIIFGYITSLIWKIGLRTYNSASS